MQVLFLSTVSGAFFCIDGQHQHQRAKGVLRVRHIDGIGIGPIPDLFGNGCNLTGGGIDDLIIPFEEIPLHLPTIAINMILGAEEGKLPMDTAHIPIPQIHLKFRQEGKEPLPNGADLISLGIKDLQAMAPGQLPFYGIDRLPRFIIDIVTVEPGKEALFE